MLDFSYEQVNQFVLQKQHLTEDTISNDIEQITKDIGGLHSTNQTTPYLSLFNRISDFTKNQLDEEVYIKRNLGKIRCIRKTVFIHHKEHVPWIINATKKQYLKRHVDYLAHLNISEERYQKIIKQILSVLEGRSLSVSEIKNELDYKENISAMVNLACDEFKIIRTKPIKSWRDRRHTYSSFVEHFPDIDLKIHSEKESKTKLVKYYIECFGPVSENDIVWWTGFNKTETRQALEDIQEDLTKISFKETEQELYILAAQLEKLKQTSIPSNSIINILPELDSYLMGYKERDRYINQSKYDHMFDRSGNATATILLNGQVKGIWDFISSGESTIKFFLFEKLESKLLDNIQTKLQAIGKFIFEEEAKLKECESMKPLKTRTPGEVQTPLKNC